MRGSRFSVNFDNRLPSPIANADCEHVGFLYHDGAEVYFIHSSYVEPSETIREKTASSPVPGASKYRVVGKISGDAALILKWLNQTIVPTVKR